MEKKYKKPYVINKAAFPLLVILLFIAMGLSIYFDNIEESKSVMAGTSNSTHVTPEEKKKCIIYKTMRDILVVLSSTFGASMLIGIVVTKRDNNNMYEDFVTNELIVSSAFLDKLTPKNKEKILAYIDKKNRKTYPDSSDYIDMISHINEKGRNLSSSMYYSDLSIEIDCEIKDNYIKKVVTRKMKLRTFKKEERLRKFVIDTHSCEKVENKKSYEIEYLDLVKSTGRISLVSMVKSIPIDISRMESKYCNYNNKIKNELNYTLLLHDTEDTVLEYKYITRVPLSDKSYTSRLKYPAKNFDFKFSIEGGGEHRIYSQAFGYMNDATNSYISPGPNSINYSFDEWLFEYDGVAVSFE